jgi:putative ABC transport system substrate-binding protein
VVFTGTFTDVPGLDIINSVREPGGNITGVRVASQEDASKRLEIMLEIAPNAKRIFVPYFKGYPNVPMMLGIIRPQAASKGVELIEFGTNNPQELQAKMDSFVTSSGVGIDAILQLGEPLAVTPVFYSILGKFSYEHRIPIGGTMTNIEGKYSSIFGLLVDGKNVGGLAALQADKIFKGTPAGTIPVITPEHSLIVNYKAAQDLGVTVPDGLLKQADQVIR